MRAEILNVDPTVPVYMRVGNDGTFPSGQAWSTYEERVQHAMHDPGRKVVTLTVYAQFMNGNRYCDTVQDDIVYDGVPSTVSAKLQNGVLSITAEDQTNGSGVADMQISPRQEFSADAWQPFTTTLTINDAMGKRLYLGIRDGVGNVSEPLLIQDGIYLPLIAR